MRNQCRSESIRVKHAFIKAHREEIKGVGSLCLCPSGSPTIENVPDTISLSQLMPRRRFRGVSSVVMGFHSTSSLVHSPFASRPDENLLIPS